MGVFKNLFKPTSSQSDSDSNKRDSPVYHSTLDLNLPSTQYPPPPVPLWALATEPELSPARRNYSTVSPGRRNFGPREPRPHPSTTTQSLNTRLHHLGLDDRDYPQRPVYPVPPLATRPIPPPLPYSHAPPIPNPFPSYPVYSSTPPSHRPQDPYNKPLPSPSYSPNRPPVPPLPLPLLISRTKPHSPPNPSSLQIPASRPSPTRRKKSPSPTTTEIIEISSSSSSSSAEFTDDDDDDDEDDDASSIIEFTNTTTPGTSPSTFDERPSAGRKVKEKEKGKVRREKQRAPSPVKDKSEEKVTTTTTPRRRRKLKKEEDDLDLDLDFLSSSKSKPHSSTRREGSSSSSPPKPSTLSTPTPRRSRQGTPSSPSPSPSPTKSRSKLTNKIIKVQCQGLTFTGKRCTRFTTPRSLLRRGSRRVVEGEEEGDGEGEEEVEKEPVYCHQHTKSSLVQTGCFIRTNSEERGEGGGSTKRSKEVWINYNDWILPDLPLETQSLLRYYLEKPISEKDREGYIYIHELIDKNSPPTNNSARTYLKLGRTIHPILRLTQWRSSCPSLDPIVRDILPRVSSSSCPNSGAGQQVGSGNRVGFAEKGTRNHFRWERLCLIEIAGRIKVLYDDNDEDRDDEGIRVGENGDKCRDCGKKHLECFRVGRDAFVEMDSMGGAGGGGGGGWVVEIVERWERWSRDVVG